MSNRWDELRQEQTQCVHGIERKSKQLELSEQGEEERREERAEKQIEQDLAGFTDTNKKFVGCSDCIRKSLDGFKQGIYII